MIRDKNLRILFIPLLGIMIPAVSGMITYSRYSVIEIIAANIYFIATSFCIWMGSIWIHSKMRTIFRTRNNPFVKIASLCAISILFGASIGSASTMLWFYFSKNDFSWTVLLKFNLLCAIAIIVFTLVYEILFLNKERELDSKIVKQLDRERSQAELEALQNEL